MPKLSKQAGVEKQKITTDDMWKSLVYDYISSDKRGKTNFYELLRTKYKCEKANTLKMYDKYELEYDLANNKGKDDVLTAKGVEAVESGLKLKLERQLELQNDIFELQELLKKGTCKDTFINKAEKPQEYERDLLPSEIANYKKTIIQLHAELSKMAGDYAPTKTTSTDSQGNDLPKSINIIMPHNLKWELPSNTEGYESEYN